MERLFKFIYKLELLKNVAYKNQYFLKSAQNVTWLFNYLKNIKSKIKSKT